MIRISLRRSCLWTTKTFCFWWPGFHVPLAQASYSQLQDFGIMGIQLLLVFAGTALINLGFVIQGEEVMGQPQSTAALQS